MGLFLHQICVRHPDLEEVARLVQAQLLKMGFKLADEVVSANEAVTLFPPRDGWIVFFLPPAFERSEALTRELSLDLEADAFYFHIHDGLLWMYVFYLRGQERDRFTSLPEYWDDLGYEEREEWLGSPRLLATHFGADPDEVSRYLVFLDEEGNALDNPELDTRRPPHPDDHFPLFSPWVMTDFQRRLGIAYPDVEGEVDGFQMALIGLKAYAGDVEDDEVE